VDYGFYVPVLLSGVAWENKSWKLFGINAGYYFTALLAGGDDPGVLALGPAAAAGPTQ
jgi:hypothetical protein